MGRLSVEAKKETNVLLVNLLTDLRQYVSKVSSAGSKAEKASGPVPFTMVALCNSEWNWNPVDSGSTHLPTMEAVHNSHNTHNNHNKQSKKGDSNDLDGSSAEGRGEQISPKIVKKRRSRMIRRLASQPLVFREGDEIAVLQKRASPDPSSSPSLSSSSSGIPLSPDGSDRYWLGYNMNSCRLGYFDRDYARLKRGSVRQPLASSEGDEGKESPQYKFTQLVAQDDLIIINAICSL